MRAHLTADEIKALLDLTPHPEGGFFGEIYRSAETIPASALPDRYAGPRSFGTAIHYLLTPDSFSAMHRVQSDEMFHFYLGDPVELVQLHPDGTGVRLLLGSDLPAGVRPVALVPRGVWQGLRLLPGGRYALLGATVTPGFDYADFELGNREDLIAEYPAFRDSIRQLTRA